MVFIPNLALLTSALLGLTTAAPALTPRQTFTPGTQNTTQEFYLRMHVVSGQHKYNNYALQTYHTGAGLADPVFTSSTGSRAFLNGTNLQFDVNDFAFSANAEPGDTNYARWEPVGIQAGYGSGAFVNKGGKVGIVSDNVEFGGWLVCEWFHGVDAPQLFQMIKGFDDPADVFPATCAKVNLVPEYF